MKLNRVHILFSLLLVILFQSCNDIKSQKIPISTEEYLLFSKSIEYLNNLKKLHNILLRDSTIFEESIEADMTLILKNDFSNNIDSIKEDFYKNNTKSFYVDSAKLLLSSPYKFINKENISKFMNKTWYYEKTKDGEFQHSKGFYYFSRPGFDEEKKNAIIYIAFICGGLCGNGYYLTFEKIGNSWEVIRKYELWIS